MDRIGIESIGLAWPKHCLALKDLAAARGVDASKYVRGIGQEIMGVLAPDEDIVTLGAEAAKEALSGVDIEKIDTVLLATESGIDQSKAASIYMHKLLGLPKNCRALEVKQACSSSSVALQMALAQIALHPKKKVLLIASDVARYGLGAAGEPTQGAGAVAMVISNEPKILNFDFEHGSYTEDVMDFWRPNYKDEAIVDGKYSIKVYLRALTECWNSYAAESGRAYDDFDGFCYHLPFTQMARKAHSHLAKINKAGFSDEQMQAVEPALLYGRLLGNAYTAALYIGLCSLLEQSTEDFSGKRLGFFAYGSGCVGTFFSAAVCAGYRDHLNLKRLDELKKRQTLSVAQYEDFYNYALPQETGEFRTPSYSSSPFRFAGLSDHKRIYEVQEVMTEPSVRPRSVLATQKVSKRVVIA